MQLIFKNLNQNKKHIMKTNQLRTSRIGILFSLAALLLFPLISNAQLKVLSTSGNVGIGTTGPIQKFVVTDLNVITNSAGNSTVVTSDAAAANKGGSLTLGGLYTGGGSVPAPFAGIAGRYTSGTSGYMALSTLNSGAMVEWMRITSLGNVGIGTSAPQSPFHVKASTNYGGVRISPTTDNLESSIGFFSDAAGTTNSTAWVVGQGGWGNTNDFVIGQNAAKLLIENSTGYVGIGITGPQYLLDVQGGTNGVTKNINTNGLVQSNGNVLTSDQMFKTNIDSLQNALAIILQLKPKSYYFDTLNFNGVGKFNFQSVKQYGFIAQEIETILPELVVHSVKPAILDSLGNVINPAYAYRAITILLSLF
jgi:hypothetical protein